MSAQSDAPEPQQTMHAHLIELEQALSDEIDALRDGDAGALLTAADTKRRCLAALERNWRSQAQSVSDAGRGTTQFSDELYTLMKRCREMNAVAGAAIAAMDQRVTALMALLGHSQENAAYSASGRRTGSTVGVGSRRDVIC